MKVLFTRWCIDAKGRTPVAVEPARVDCVEHYGDAYGGEKYRVQVELWHGENSRMRQDHHERQTGILGTGRRYGGHRQDQRGKGLKVETGSGPSRRRRAA